MNQKEKTSVVFPHGSESDVFVIGSDSCKQSEKMPLDSDVCCDVNCPEVMFCCAYEHCLCL